VTKYMASIVIGRVKEKKDHTLTDEKIKEMASFVFCVQITDTVFRHFTSIVL